MASISCWICSSATSGSRRPTSRPLYCAKLGLREHADLDRELERLALRRQLAQIELRVAHRHDAGALDRVGVPAGERVAHCLLEHDLAADPLDDQRRGHLPAAKAGQLQLTPQLLRLALQPALHLARRHLHLQAHARVPELGDGCLERRLAPPPRYRAAPCGLSQAPRSAGAPRRGYGRVPRAIWWAARWTSWQRSRATCSHGRAAGPFARSGRRARTGAAGRAFARRPPWRSWRRTPAARRAARRAPGRWRSRSGATRRSSARPGRARRRAASRSRAGRPGR